MSKNRKGVLANVSTRAGLQSLNGAMVGLKQCDTSTIPPIAPYFHTKGDLAAPIPYSPRWRHDARLDRAFSNAWGVFYLEDEDFRNIICSYFVWDHPAWAFFDEDDFLDRLVASPPVSSSKCLVHAIIAFASVCGVCDIWTATQ